MLRSEEDMMENYFYEIATNIIIKLHNYMGREWNARCASLLFDQAKMKVEGESLRDWLCEVLDLDEKEMAVLESDEKKFSKIVYDEMADAKGESEYDSYCDRESGFESPY